VILFVCYRCYEYSKIPYNLFFDSLTLSFPLFAELSLNIRLSIFLTHFYSQEKSRSISTSEAERHSKE
jgi:hypothetical protein